jgi:hypothetical protein
MNPSGNLSCKRTLVGWMSGSRTQRDEIGFAEDFCDLGDGIIFAEGLHNWGDGTCHFFTYTLATALQLRKKMEYLSQGTWLE